VPAAERPAESAAPAARAALVRRATLGLAALALLVVVLVASDGEEDGFVSFAGEAMATRWELLLPAGAESERAAEECLALYAALDRELSEWREGSPLSAVNHAAGVAPVAVPEELFRLVERSVELGRATEGAFDVSWAALWGLWDFRAKEPRLPDPRQVAERLARVDFRRIVLDPAARTILLPESGMKLGLGAIGKGYALDRAAALLEARGYRDLLLVGGGQVLARGRRGERPWRIGVRDPRGGPRDLVARIDVSGQSLSTSADNESYFEIDGVRYHHVLDPRTGWPAKGLRSATVVHPDATLADALSTALLVLGRERGLEVAGELGAEALVIDAEGDLAFTPGLAARLELLAPPRRD